MSATQTQNLTATRVLLPMLSVRYPVLVVQHKNAHPQAAPSANASENASVAQTLPKPPPVLFVAHTHAPKIFLLAPNTAAAHAPPEPFFAAHKLTPPPAFHRQARREVVTAKIVATRNTTEPRNHDVVLSPIAQAKRRMEEKEKTRTLKRTLAAAPELQTPSQTNSCATGKEHRTNAQESAEDTDLLVLATVALNANNVYYRKVSLMKSLSFTKKEIKPYERLPGRADGLTAGQALFALHTLCGDNNDREFWFTLASNRKILPFRELRDDFNERNMPINHNDFHYIRTCMCRARAADATSLFDHAVFCLRYQAARFERRLWLTRCLAKCQSGIQSMRGIAERHGWIPEEIDDARVELEAMDSEDGTAKANRDEQH